VSVRLAGGAMTHGCACLLALADLKIYDVDGRMPMPIAFKSTV
jgi:hypothetical protein